MRELLPLVGTLVEKIAFDNEKIKAFVQKDWIQLEILRSVYCTLVASKELTPIENLSEEEKKRLKELVRVWGTGDVKNKMMQARILHLIEQLQNKKIEL